MGLEIFLQKYENYKNAYTIFNLSEFEKIVYWYQRHKHIVILFLNASDINVANIIMEFDYFTIFQRTPFYNLGIINFYHKP